MYSVGEARVKSSDEGKEGKRSEFSIEFSYFDSPLSNALIADDLPR